METKWLEPPQSVIEPIRQPGQWLIVAHERLAEHPRQIVAGQRAISVVFEQQDVVVPVDEPGLERADETAAPFITTSQIKPEFVPEFDEIGIGDLRNRDLAVIKAKLYQRPFIADFSEYDGESSAEFAGRVIDALQSRVLEHFKQEQ